MRLPLLAFAIVLIKSIIFLFIILFKVILFNQIRQFYLFIYHKTAVLTKTESKMVRYRTVYFNFTHGIRLE